MAVRLYHCSNTSVTVSGQTLVAGTRALRGQYCPSGGFAAASGTGLLRMGRGSIRGSSALLRTLKTSWVCPLPLQLGPLKGEMETEGQNRIMPFLSFFMLYKVAWKDYLL